MSGRAKELDGKPVREVPPDWIGRVLPKVPEDGRPEVAWWALHPDGRVTPVWTQSIRPGRKER